MNILNKFIKYLTRRDSVLAAEAKEHSIAIGRDVNAPITVISFYAGGDSFRGSGGPENVIDAPKIKQLMATHFDDGVSVRDAIDRELNAEIDAYRDLIKDEKVKEANELLKKLLSRVSSTASHKIIFRIKANIGVCSLALGNEEDGAREILEACDFAPDEPKAVANRVLALVLLNRSDEALAFGRKKLESDSENSVLAGYLVQACKSSKAISDPLTIIPPSLHKTAEVMLGYAFFLRMREKSFWREIAKEGASLHPDDPYLAMWSAEACIEDIITSDDYRRVESLTAEQIKGLSAASKVLQIGINKVIDNLSVVSSSWNSIFGNLLIAEAALGDKSGFLFHAKKAFDVSIGETGILAIIANGALDFASPAVAAEAIARMNASPEMALAQFRLGVFQNDLDALSKIADDSIQGISSLSDRNLVKAGVKYARLIIAGEVSEAAFDALLSESFSYSRACLMLSELARRSGLDEASKKAYEKGILSLGDDAGYADAIMALRAAHSRDLWRDVIRIARRRVNVSHDNEELRILSEAYLNDYPITASAVEFFRGLSSEVLKIEFYGAVSGNFFVRLGDYEVARPILERVLISRPNDLQIFLPLARIYRSVDREKFSEFIAGADISSLRGGVSSQVMLARVLSEGGRKDDALDYAYRLTGENRNDPDVAMCYVSICLSREGGAPIPTTDIVSSECWVSLENQSGERYDFVITEDAAGHVFNRHDLNHLYSSKAIGLKVGDQFVQRRPHGGNITWTVLEIKSKYLHVLHEIMNDYERKFPDSNNLFRMNFKGDNIDGLLDLVRNKAQAEIDVADFYFKKGMPLAFCAEILGREQISFAGFIRSLGRDFICCGSGALAEYEIAEGVAAEHIHGGLVLDTYSAWLAYELQVLDVLVDMFEVCFVSSTTINELLRLKEGYGSEGSKSLFLSWRDGTYYKNEISDEQRRKSIENIDHIIGSLREKCEICPFVVPDQLNETESNYIDALSPEVFAPMFLAREKSCLLLSEDFFYRRFVSGLSGSVKSIWIQPIFMLGFKSGFINHEKYAEVLLGLTKFRHTHVSIDTKSLFSIFESDDTENLNKFEVVADYLGSRNYDFFSHFSVGRDCINMIWASDKADIRIQRATGILLESLLRMKEWDLAIAGLRCLATDRLGQYIDGWVEGHFLPKSRVSAVIQKLLEKTVRNQGGLHSRD